MQTKYTTDTRERGKENKKRHTRTAEGEGETKESIFGIGTNNEI